MVGGGNGPPNNASALTETWDGSSWTETTDLNTARNLQVWDLEIHLKLQLTCLVVKIQLPSSNTTQKQKSWNGTTWTEVK